MYRNMIGASLALAILTLLVGTPAPGYAHEGSKLCNVILDGDGDPLLESDSDEIAHSNSSDCPDDQENTAAVTNAPAADVTVDPLTVYFGVNRDGLDAGSRAEVEAYVAELLVNPPAALDVVGYTDTSGSVDLNARLSEARASSVTAALIEAGVPAGMIESGASGEESLAVSTPDDTREANNRRVTVTPQY